MPHNHTPDLSRRERQIMDICIQQETPSARDVWKTMPDAPSYATVRKILTILVEKGELKRKPKGRHFLYLPTRSRKNAAHSAARRLLDTFYRGSLEDAVMGLIGAQNDKASPDELERIEKMIIEAKKLQKPNQD